MRESSVASSRRTPFLFQCSHSLKMAPRVTDMLSPPLALDIPAAFAGRAEIVRGMGDLMLLPEEEVLYPRT